MDFFQLNDGARIPRIGFGTYKMTDPKQTVDAVEEALRVGYTHIDTAAVYANEEYVGQAVRRSGIPREQLYLTSKVWNTDRGYDTTLRACEASLKRLGTDWLDLYLIHWPAAAHQFPDDWMKINAETWRALERLKEEGMVRSIGLSNFMPHHIEPLLAAANIAPAVDQIEFHPGYMQRECLEWCQAHGLLVEAWSPLGRGRVLSDPLLLSLAEKYGVTVAQVCLGWVLAHGVLPLPKSVTPERILENTTPANLSAADVQAVDAMPLTGWSGHTPDTVAF